MYSTIELYTKSNSSYNSSIRIRTWTKKLTVSHTTIILYWNKWLRLDLNPHNSLEMTVNLPIYSTEPENIEIIWVLFPLKPWKVLFKTGRIGIEPMYHDFGDQAIIPFIFTFLKQKRWSPYHSYHATEAFPTFSVLEFLFKNINRF